MQTLDTRNVDLPKPKVLKQPQKAFWGKGRKYKRHSVENDFKKFCGFTTLKRIVAIAQPEILKAFIVFLWATGGRVSETLKLRKEMFTLRIDTEPPILIVDGAPLEKRYAKVAEYIECKNCREPNHTRKECEACGADLMVNGQRRFITERHIDEARNEFAIRLDDPFADIILDWLKDCDNYLFLNPMTNRPYSRKWAYNKIREIGDKLGLSLWPHRFRAERASYLGTHLRAESLLEWFSWESWNTAKKYSKKGALGLAKELGVKVKNEE